MVSESLERLIETLKRLPGIGRRTAERLAFHIVQTEPSFVNELVHGLNEVKNKVLLCSTCCNLTEIDPCKICDDERRDHATICVVETPAAVNAIESTGEYHGIYHVLHGTISPLDGSGPEELKINELVTRIKNENISEIILATNHNVEGDGTARYLSDLLTGFQATVTRLASGIPIGGALIYADHATLARALSGRGRF